MNRLMKTILGIVLALVLCFTIFFETKYLLNLFTQRQDALYQSSVLLANRKAQANVSIDRVYEYPEIILDYVGGDVIRVKDLDYRVQLNGLLTDDSDSDTGIYYYTDAENISHTLSVEKKTVAINTYQEGMLDYWNVGSYEKILAVYELAYQDENIEQYQHLFNGDRYVVILDTARKLYHMFVDQVDSIVILSSDMPFTLSDDVVTARFANPMVEVLRAHSYSMYELDAARNTQAKLAEKSAGGKKDVTVDVPSYTSPGVVGTSDTYTSSADENLRKEMVSYGNYAWDRNGEADGTTMTIDFTSEEAKRSQWTLTDKTYSYSRAGLLVNGVSATRGDDSFEVSCNINNTIDTERPFVLVLKYISTDNKLLGISVLDYRATPISSKGVTVCRKTITQSEIGMSCNNVYAVQFEVY